MPLSFAAADNGILPDRMITALVESGAILPSYPFAPDQVLSGYKHDAREGESATGDARGHSCASHGGLQRARQSYCGFLP